MCQGYLLSIFVDEAFRVELVRIDKVLGVVHDEGDVGHEVGPLGEGVGGLRVWEGDRCCRC